jgi:serine/threonine-protein kinase HipA
MSTVAEVRLWGRTIGAVSVPGPGQVATFEYESEFRRSGLEVAPLMMPTSGTEYSFPALSRASFHGLPGMLADALPDKFGNAVIASWLASQGRLPEDLDAVERLCYTGTRGMGALEFKPVAGPGAGKSELLKVDALVGLASEVLRGRENLRTSIAEPKEEKALLQILRVGASAGGARAKALIAWNPETNEVRSGQVKAPEGFGYWLMKFDGVSGNSDRDMADPKGFGAIEYAYSLMAKAAGIRMSDCRLFEEHGRRHFMTRRFDRLPSGKKLHMQSLAALAHLDFNDAGAHSYEQAFEVMKRLGLRKDDVEEQFRRMVFNVVARNQDDHVKNIAFLMDQRGTWSLSPAFDVMYSYNPAGQWTKQHQMSLAGKRDGFTLEDLRAVASTASLKRGRAEEITREVTLAVRRWRDFAGEANVPPAEAEQIRGVHRIDLIS